MPEALREVFREIDRRLGREADPAEAMRLMTAAYILSGLRVPKRNLISIYPGGAPMEEELTLYDEVVENVISHSHRLILLQGRKRFGDPDDAEKSELLAIRDLDQLERLSVAILSAESWKELLATP